MTETDLTGIELHNDLRERRITADYIADALREAIHGGDLADGAVLNQAALATHFGVSRVPVREAMRQLQAEGLIETHAHRLAVVRSLDLVALAEVFDLRALLEGYLVERALPNIDAALLARLRATEDEMCSERDYVRWRELNTRFHRALYEPSRAVMTLEIVDQLRARTERYVRLWSREFGDISSAGPDHVQILEAVAAGDPVRARAAIEHHIAEIRAKVISLPGASAAAVDALP